MSIRECDGPHDWQPDEQSVAPGWWACANCPATSATCAVCKGPSGWSLLICDRCERREQRVLEDIPRILRQADGASGGGGPSLTGRVSGTRAEDIDSIREPEDVYDALWGWVAAWAEYAGAANTDAIDYLSRHIRWAVHNPEASRWEQYRHAVRALRAASLAVVGLAPHRLADRCMHCGGRVVQDRADARGVAFEDGLQDVARCTGCGMTWGDRTAFQRVVRQAIHELGTHHPDLYVTREQARRIYPDVASGTVRQWLKRDRDRYWSSIREWDAWFDRWTAWEAEGNIGPLPQQPEIAERDVREDDDGRLRLGDLHVLVARLAAISSSRESVA